MSKKGSNTPDYGTIRELIQKAAGTYGKTNVRLFDATVNSVNVELRTANVDSIDNSLYGLDVRFMLEVSDGDMSVPTVGSTVTVAMTDLTEPYIVEATWIDEKLFVVGNQSYSIKDGQQIFNDGGFDGLVKVIDLTTRLNNIENLLNQFITLFNSHTHAVPSLGTSATPLPQETSSINPITQQSDIENPNITHGSNF